MGYFIMADDEGNVYAFLSVGVAAGLYSFFKGFRVFREYRVLEDTPLIPLRSVAMGLVHVHGRATASEYVTSPVTQTRCCFYKVDIAKWKTEQRGGRWEHYCTDEDGVRFYLADNSGKVLVDARGAELDLLESGKREVGGPGAGVAHGADPAEVQKFISRMESLQHAPAGWGFPAASGRYRFTEYCIVPDHWYDVTGTCTENPGATSDADRNLIVKGEAEPTFLISRRPAQGIEKHLRRRAALMILGGAALSVVCLGVLLAKLGLL